MLNAQQTYQRALMTFVFVQSDRLSHTAALFQALRGGWWNRNDVEPAKKGCPSLCRSGFLTRPAILYV